MTGSSRLRVRGAQPRQDVQAAQAGHLDVEQDEVERGRGRERERLGAVRRHGDVESSLPQPPGQRVPVGLVVVHDEQRTGAHDATLSRQQRFDLGQELLEPHRLGVEIVAAGRERHLAVVDHRVRAQDDERNVPRRGVRLQLPRRFPAVDARQAEIHQDEIGQRRSGDRHRLLAVHGQQDPIASALETAGERVAARLVVLRHHDRRQRCSRVMPPCHQSGSAAASTTVSGRRTVKRDPSPGRLSTDTLPPMS